jgi:hypothetical protein
LIWIDLIGFDFDLNWIWFRFDLIWFGLSCSIILFLYFLSLYFSVLFLLHQRNRYVLFVGVIVCSGSSSRLFSSKSFHLDLGDLKVEGVKKIALKAGEMDNSLVREIKTCQLLYALGAPVYRSSYYQLFVNQVLFFSFIFFCKTVLCTHKHAGFVWCFRRSGGD